MIKLKLIFVSCVLFLLAGCGSDTAVDLVKMEIWIIVHRKPLGKWQMTTWMIHPGHL